MVQQINKPNQDNINGKVAERNFAPTAIIQETKTRFSSEKHPLLKYAGILSEEERDNLMKEIKSNRVNKDIAEF